jgi:phage-related protein
MKKLSAIFFRTLAGNEPVRTWLLELDKADRRLIGVAVKDTEFSWPIGLPLCRAIKGQKGLWEVRCDITGNRIARVMFMISGDSMVLLHGFIKKTQKTEQKEIDLAVKRKKEFESYGK